MKLPVLSRELVRRVDREAVEQCGMSGLVLMENAGRGCVDTLCEIGIDGPVAICCGSGNNAGDGFVMARHLDILGEQVKVLLWADPERLSGDAAANYRILTKTGVPIAKMSGEFNETTLRDELEGADWIVDALLGTGARGAPRDPLGRVIDSLNAHPARRLAVDLPSGLDCDTGVGAAHTFRADHTCTFVAAKPGFLLGTADRYTGTIHVIDIGVPRTLVERIVALAGR